MDSNTEISGRLWMSPSRTQRRLALPAVPSRTDFEQEACSGNSVGKAMELPFALHEPPQRSEPTYGDWLKSTVLRSRALVYFTAFYLHWLMMIILAVIFIHVPETFSAVKLVASITDPSDRLLESLILLDAEVEMPLDASIVKDVAINPIDSVLPAHQVVDDLQIAESLLQDFAALENASTNAVAAKARQKRPLTVEHPRNTPQEAVIAGSFAVWTEPTNPRPGEPYRIIIQICLPDGTRVYDLADLEGVVVGSDGYRKPIPGHFSGTLPITDGCVKIIVPVVCADAKVKDIVYVRSKLLKEMQQLTIEF